MRHAHDPVSCLLSLATIFNVAASGDHGRVVPTDLESKHVIFHATHVRHTRDLNAGVILNGWAVQRTATGDGACLVTRIYETKREAQDEAFRLNILGIRWATRPGAKRCH